MSATCQTTIAAISTGLPSASLTLRWLVSKLRTRTLTARRVLSGDTSQPGAAHGADVAAEELHDRVCPGCTTTSEISRTTATATGSPAHPGTDDSATTTATAVATATPSTPHHPLIDPGGALVDVHPRTAVPDRGRSGRFQQCLRHGGLLAARKVISP